MLGRNFFVAAPARQVLKVALYRDQAKRALDVTISAALLPVVLPVITVLALLVRLDGGPALFAHPRVGRNGRIFSCLKLRTMHPDAQTRLAQVLADDPLARAEWHAYRKLANDPRVTGIGRILRALSLDELPQILNVLRGDMSLVGPRPVTQDELKNYRDRSWVYHTLRPGLTGLWQVSGRSALTYRDRVELDTAYLRAASLKLDLLILFRTLPALVARSGR